MNKPQQATYHSIFVGVKNLSDEIQVPALSGEELYNIFFQMRLDHPEIFWVTNFKYRYYKDSPNLIFIPEYLFEKKQDPGASEGSDSQGREACPPGTEDV